MLCCVCVCERLPPQVVENRHVGVGVVQVVGVGRVVFLGPISWQRTVQVEDVVLWFGLVVHAVETHHLWRAGGVLNPADPC